MSFFIARYFSQSWDVNALDSGQEKRVQTLQENVQKQINEDVDIERALKRVGARGRWNLMAVNNATNEIILGFPSPLLKQRERFLSLKEAQRPLLIRTNNMEFVGPFLITANDQNYRLFAGRLLRRGQRPVFAFGLALVVFLITGTVACIAIAWTIAKPIKELSQLSNDFASGLTSEISPNATEAFKKRKDELGQLHNDIYDMASNLAKSLSQQKALMANISHELRTPLTRLQLALAMLNPSGEEQVLYAKRIEKDIGVMDVLIGQALQLAKMNDENHAQWLQLENTLLQEVLLPVLDDLSFEAQASEITLTVNNGINGSLALALIRTSFVSAIENVTRNAIKYSEKQVRITLDLSVNHASHKMLRIQIEDDGEGLSDEQRTHIFEPFYRAPSGKHYQGTGLGLAIAKASVQLHNGEINVQPSDMGGLCICLLFPLTL
ncbi:MAG: two-component system sensor histidine kinase CpxA [Alphaproteobacteria bacterium]|jgi:two-component system sensor histidine kinase CpxA